MVMFPLEIFYDGSCLVCSAEMARYRERNEQGRLQFIDISSPDFIAGNYGKTQDEFMARLHVRDSEGRFFTGVDAFMMIWQAYPDCSPYRLLSAVIGLPGLNLLARGGYTLFARYRHLLPDARKGCRGGTCDIKH